MPRPRREPHQLDNLSAEELEDAANGNDPAGWESQRQGFVRLRDVSDELVQASNEALTQLRQSWSGGGAEAFSAEFDKLIAGFTELRDSSSSNADGMREMAVVLRGVREEVELLRLEDKDWKDNPEGDDADTVSGAREDIRRELRDKLKDADESYQHLAGAYLLQPPEPPQLSGMQTVALGIDNSQSGAGASAETGPQLQSTQPQHGQPAAAPVEPAPAAAPPAEAPPPSSTPMMPMGGGMGGGMGGETSGGGGGSRSGSAGPQFKEARNVPPSRMRSQASRQDLHNQLEHGTVRREDPQQQRRAVEADDDSPFAPSDSEVVPPVISGGVPVEGPHDSGPVMTGTVYRHFPEYGVEESTPDITEEYEDGSSVNIDLGDDDEPPVKPEPEPKPTSDHAKPSDKGETEPRRERKPRQRASLSRFRRRSLGSSDASEE